MKIRFPISLSWIYNFWRVIYGFIFRFFSDVGITTIEFSQCCIENYIKMNHHRNIIIWAMMWVDEYQRLNLHTLESGWFSLKWTNCIFYVCVCVFFLLLFSNATFNHEYTMQLMFCKYSLIGFQYCVITSKILHYKDKREVDFAYGIFIWIF